ncbi:MAG TPA: hypothetical protein VG982_01955 [Candidatus Paceibacterota bacterium]|jgi:hypothetical protein|nr:hypothetical protein [Candidatus Paceibacterota bacterium]
MLGKLVEQELLGKVKKEIMEFNGLHEIKTYQPYKTALQYVKNHQYGDPEKPHRFFPKSLIGKIKENKELFSGNGEEKIAFYTAIDSILDLKHGVDAFFEYRKNAKEPVVRVTFDVTTNPSKDQYKAEVILLIPSEGLDPSDTDYEDRIGDYSHQIISELLTKLEKNAEYRKID